MSLKLAFNIIDNMNISIRIQYGWCEELYNKFFKENFKQIGYESYLYLDWGNIEEFDLFKIKHCDHNINLIKQFLYDKNININDEHIEIEKLIEKFITLYYAQYIKKPNIVTLIEELENFGLDINKDFIHIQILINKSENYNIIISIKQLKEIYGVDIIDNVNKYNKLMKKIKQLACEIPFYFSMYINDEMIEIPELTGVYEDDLKEIFSLTKSNFNDYVANYVYTSYKYDENNKFSKEELDYIRNTILKILPKSLPNKNDNENVNNNNEINNIKINDDIF